MKFVVVATDCRPRGGICAQAQWSRKRAVESALVDFVCYFMVPINTGARAGISNAVDAQLSGLELLLPRHRAAGR